MSFAEGKHFIFIISTGRTGTKFMGNVMSDMIDNSHSVHEPDSLDFDKNLRHNVETIDMLGVKGATIDKVLGKTGIYNISRKFLSGELSEEETIQAVIKHRGKYYKKIRHKVVIESHYGWYGLIPVIRKIYPSFNILLVYRDPKTWIKSNIDFGTLYGKRDYLDRLFGLRIKPSMVGEDNKGAWKAFDQFEKLCWYWQYVNGLLRSEAVLPNTTETTYEELFASEDKVRHWQQMLDKVCQFNEISIRHELKATLLEKRYNESVSTGFPDYINWSENQKQYLASKCGNLMQELGY